MSQLHVFNPSHDEALAANSPYYYPARAARMLAADLAVLPAWWAKSDDWVLLPDEVTIPEEGPTSNGIRFIHLAEVKRLSLQDIDDIQPWGWDPLLVHQLRKAGISTTILPNTEQLEKIRHLSSRQTAVDLLKAVREDFPETIGTSFWCTQMEEIQHLIAEYGNMMLKAPWSSSGRGVFAVGQDIPENVLSRIQRLLKEQGAIEAEPLYRRVADFALEFYAHKNLVVYQGLSVFATTGNGAYTGNIVGEEELLLHQLPEEIRHQIPEVTQSLRTHLHELIGSDYEGPLGVDLMSVQTEDESLVLHPCVEINLRRTMGHVALALRSEIPQGRTGIYSIRPLSKTSEESPIRLTPFAKKMEALLFYE